MTLLFSARDLIVCRGCGCDDDHACVKPDGSPCSWFLRDIETPTGICSACAVRVGYDMRALLRMGIDLDEEEAA